MAIVKKNLVSIIFGVIALLAVVASYYPLGGYIEELQGKVAARAQVSSQVSTLISTPRSLPVVSVDETPPENLPGFPTAKTIAKGEEIVKAVETENKNIREAAINMNVHKPLAPGALPAGGPAERINFRELYRAAMPVPQPAGTGAPAADGSIAPVVLSKLALDLRAGVPVSAAQITKALADEKAKIEKEQLYGGREEAAQILRDRSQKLPDEMQMAVAQKSMIYVDPNTFDVNASITGTPDLVNIYWTQVNLWVQQDLVAAINEANAGVDPATNKAPRNVLEAPVKRLRRVVVQTPFVTGLAPGGGGGAPGTPDPAPPTDPDAPLEKKFAVSPTGRVSNGLFDVVHFYMQVDVDAEHVPMFLKTLGKNRFMNAYKVEVKILDGSAIYAEGMRYGNKPTVSLNIEGETMFFRKWNEAFMPAAVKSKLGITAAGAAAP